jgi:hypothetical protein
LEKGYIAWYIVFRRGSWVDINLGMWSVQASAYYPALVRSLGIPGTTLTYLALGIQQLHSSASGRVRDRIVFSVLVVAQGIEAVRGR